MISLHAYSAGDVQTDRSNLNSNLQIPIQVAEEFGIETYVVTSADLEERIALNGEVALIPENVVHVSSPVEGIVTQVNKSLGDSVESGDVLAQLNSRELATARAELLAASSRSKLARATFEREKNLFDKKISSESDYLAAEQALAAAMIDEKSARHRLVALGVDSEDARADKSRNTLTTYRMVAAAPGVIVEKHITSGELVGPSSRSFVIADLSEVWLELTVYQKDFDLVRPGLRVTINRHPTIATGTIDFISPIVDRETRSTTARVVIKNSDGFWRPGMFIDTEVTIASTGIPIGIPAAAIQRVEGKTVVFVKRDDYFEVRQVMLGERSDEYVAVTEGLSQGEVIASTNSFSLKAELQKSAFGDDHEH